MGILPRFGLTSHQAAAHNGTHALRNKPLRQATPLGSGNSTAFAENTHPPATAHPPYFASYAFASISPFSPAASDIFNFTSQPLPYGSVFTNSG